MFSSCPTSAFCRWREEWHIKLFETDDVHWAGTTHRMSCHPSRTRRQAAPEITAHDPLDAQVPHPLLHHHVRVNTLHKSIAQIFGRLAHQILADRVQNRVLERDEVRDGRHPPWAKLKTNTKRDTTYKWSASSRCTRLAPVKETARDGPS